MSNYTWGKTVSDYPTTNILSLNTNGGNGFQYPNLYDRGEATFSHRHRFVYTGIWTASYGKDWPMWAKLPLTGWRLSGIGTLESGDIYTVNNGGPGTPCPTSDAGTAICPTGNGTSAQDAAGYLQSGQEFDELNVQGNANIGHGQKTFSRQFDTSKIRSAADERPRKLRLRNDPRLRAKQCRHFFSEDVHP